MFLPAWLQSESFLGAAYKTSTSSRETEEMIRLLAFYDNSKGMA